MNTPQLMQNPDQPDAQPASSTRARAQRSTWTIAAFLIAFALCIAVYPIYSYFYASTNDAEIDGHIVPVNSRVDGTVAWVNPEAEDTRFVTAGTVLARLDRDEYQPSVDKLKGQVQAEQSQLTSARMDAAIAKPTAESRLQSAVAAVAEAQADLAAGVADTRSQDAHLAQARATYANADADRQRYQALVATHEISTSEYEQRATLAITAREQTSIASAELNASQTRSEALRQRLSQRKAELLAASVLPLTLEVASAHVNQVDGELKESDAQLTEAALELGYTTIVAPISGIVGQRQLERGQRVQSGQLLLDVFPTTQLWITAFFKETQLRRVRVGQPVTFTVDAYGRKLHGHVESIGGATGSKSSLLAPENSTGNFVKVVQRVPVRIHMDQSLDSTEPLLPGMSVEVSVSLH
jgi:membrane fusion protein (multidrug efflux system)